MKRKLYEKCGVFAACEKVADFYARRNKTKSTFICFIMYEKYALPRARCHIDVGFVKPTFLIRDADLNLRIAGLPALGRTLEAVKQSLGDPPATLCRL